MARTNTIERTADAAGRTAFAAPLDRSRTMRLVATAALAAVTIGVLLQILLVVLRVSAGSGAPGVAALSEAAGSVSWSTLVCSGVALGVGAARYRAQLMGLLGLVCAPIAFACAKGVQRGVDVLMDAEPGPLGLLVLQIGAIKAVEYGLLGVAIAWLIGTGRSTKLRHAAVGLAFGLVFGSIQYVLQSAAAPGGVLPTPKLLGLLVNELLFPIGCAMVLHLIARLAEEAAHRQSQEV